MGFPLDFLSRINPSCPGFTSESSTFKAQPIPQLENNNNFTQSVQQILVSRFPYTGTLSITELGQTISMSERTIKRWLFNEGVTYREVLDRVRFIFAHQMLSDPGFSIREIAHEMGYAGSNNFIYAFKRITGLTPTKYRAAQFKKN